MKDRRVLIYLLGAVILGFVVRGVGVFWGYNFPTGWYGHHVDEYTHLVNAEILINPQIPPRWEPHPYPKGVAAHVAVPLIGIRAIQGKLFDPLPSERVIITTGRVFSLFYGTASILIIFLLANKLFSNQRVAILSAYIFALGGLHVSQSHFFLSDVPSLFWFLLGSYLLILDVQYPKKINSIYMMLAAAAYGISFGMKFSIFSLPALAMIAVAYKPRFLRVLQTAVFFGAGFVAVNFASYTPYDILKTLQRGISDPYLFHWWSNLFLYVIEYPSIVSYPIAILSIAGGVVLTIKLFRSKNITNYLPLFVIIVLPLILNVLFIIFQLDHFARHIVPLIPWISIVSAWSLIKIIDKLKTRGIHPAIILIPFFIYLGLFIFDGERFYIEEPRNNAERWLVQNVPEGTDISWIGKDEIPNYENVFFPDAGRPTVLFIEMHWANHFLSGMGLKNSYPEDYRYVFAGRSPERLKAFQDLFSGKSEYKEVTRFKVDYFMPEYRLVDSLLGDRSRNYITEIVVFQKIHQTQNTSIPISTQDNWDYINYPLGRDQLVPVSKPQFE